MISWKSSSLFDLEKRIFGLVDNMVAGGFPIWSVAPIWSESWIGWGWGAATSSVLASTPNVTPDSPHRERVAHTRGITKAVSGREKWKCFRLIVSHPKGAFWSQWTGTKHPVYYCHWKPLLFNEAMMIWSFISGLWFATLSSHIRICRTSTIGKLAYIHCSYSR